MKTEGAYLMITGRYLLSILYKNLCCGISFESHCQSDLNDYKQQRFLWKNLKPNYPEVIII